MVSDFSKCCFVPVNVKKQRRKVFCTSDCESGRGLQFSHSVFRHTGKCALIVNGSLLHPQHIVVLVILDLIPANKDITSKKLEISCSALNANPRNLDKTLTPATNKTCCNISPVPVELFGNSHGKWISPWRGAKKHDCSFWQTESASRRINYSTMTHSTQRGTQSIGTLKTCSIFMRCFSLCA